MRKASLTTIVAIASLSASAAFAAPFTEIASERTETTGFVGLTLPLVPNPMPRISIGLRQATVGSGGDVRGGTVELSFDPWSTGGVQLRATALKGDVDMAGILGGGWDFGTGSPFVTLGARVPNLSVTSDIGMGTVPSFALGLDSLGKQTAPEPTRILFFPCFTPSQSSELAC